MAAAAPAGLAASPPVASRTGQPPLAAPARWGVTGESGRVDLEPCSFLCWWRGSLFPTLFQLRPQLLEIVAATQRVEVLVLLHVGGVLVTLGDGVTEHGQRLVAVELHALGALFVGRLTVLDDGDAEQQAASGVVGVASGVPA